MNPLRIFYAVALALPLFAQGPSRPSGEADRAEPAVSGATPRVLVPLEPPDNRVITLPGGITRRPAKPAAHSLPTASRPLKALDLSVRLRPISVPVLQEGPAIEFVAPPRTPVALVDVFVPDLPPDPHAPDLPPPPAVDLVTSAEPLPGAIEAPQPAGDEFEIESALYLQKQIGHWTSVDANSLLGNAVRQRPSLDDNQSANGTILAFADPSGRYREIELDFDSQTGTLRTVFAYPLKMSWEECHTRFSGQVNAAKANKGRIFYSYVNRRLDVLVEPTGQVVSLGLY